MLGSCGPVIRGGERRKITLFTQLNWKPLVLVFTNLQIFVESMPISDESKRLSQHWKSIAVVGAMDPLGRKIRTLPTLFLAIWLTKWKRITLSAHVTDIQIILRISFRSVCLYNIGLWLFMYHSGFYKDYNGVRYLCDQVNGLCRNLFSNRNWNRFLLISEHSAKNMIQVF